MKKKNIASRAFAFILHQMRNEWRSNIALLTELLIVSSIVWYLVDSTYVMVAKAMEPMGLDISNCFMLGFSPIRESSPIYDASHPDNDDTNIADKLALIERIRHDEDIEAAAYSMRNEPFCGSYQGSNIKCDTVMASVRFVICQPDFVKVFRYQSVTGKTPDELARLLGERNCLLSEGVLGDSFDVKTFIGHECKAGVSFVENDTMPWRLADVIVPVKRFTYEEQASTKMIVLPLPNGALAMDAFYFSIAVRVKEGRADGFKERFEEKIKGKKMRAGNCYVSSITALDKIKSDSEGDEDQQLRFYAVAMVFLLLNVFLGLFGTFWFRIQHRYPEIGLQKAVGATDCDVMMRLLAEAVLLMTLAFMLSLVVDFNVAHSGLTDVYRGSTLETGRFVICAAMSYVIMLVIIGLGVWIPAVRATKANPVDVLRGE